MSYLTKPIKITLLTLALGFTTLYAEATHGHGHAELFDHLKNDVSKKAIEKSALNEIQRLVTVKKIHKSWKHVPISKIGKTHYGDTNDWIVGFDNIKIKNKKRQTLYIFVSIHGEIRGVNYTGN